MRLAILLTLISWSAIAQRPLYPQGYFRNPLGIPILLAGNFGECRPGHFHSGIDIKTDGKENLPVFAAAEGYISRIKMEPGGFGHGIYITHPNGFTTLYAHLNDFYPALQKVVRAAQYEKKNWEVDLKFSAQQFPIKKGQLIAWSGNTGGSTAPHLHFEIRNTKTEHPLNPLLFGFSITDNICPIPTDIAIYNAEESIYKQRAQQIRLRKTNSYYSPIKDSIKVNSNAINIGIAVNDFMNNSTNTLSFYTAKWYANDSLIGTVILDDIGYDETRYLNACADYKLKKESGDWYNSLFLLPNNQLKKIYRLNESSGNGKIALKENESTQVRIVLEDVLGNSSEVKFSIVKSGFIQPPICSKEWKAGQKNNFEGHPNIKFSLEPAALYDNICFEFGKKYEANSVSSRYQIHNSNVPLHKYFDLNIKAERAIPFALNSKIAMLYNDGQKTSGKACSLSEAWYSSSVRNFGDYWLVIDTTAPLIKPTLKNGSSLGAKKEIRFIITDNFTSVKKVVGSINGQWLCFEQHENNWFYRIDDYCPKGKNKLMLSAIDENGNESKIDYYFTR